MTEAEWRSSNNIGAMISYLRKNASERKQRLYACACCRLVWNSLPCDASRLAVEGSERFADHEIPQQEFEALAIEASRVHWGHDALDDDRLMSLAKFAADYAAALPDDSWQLWLVGDEVAQLLEGKVLESEGVSPEALESWASEWAESGGPPGWTSRDVYGEVRQLLRDIFGNPFRSVTLNPAWRTSNVVALAQSIYDDRAFERLPILAAALEDGGCDNADILNHCRQPSPTEHCRGCWVVDLVLGKSQ